MGEIKKNSGLIKTVFLSTFLFIFFTYYFFNMQSNLLTGKAVIESEGFNLPEIKEIKLTGFDEMFKTIAFVFIFLFALIIFSKIMHNKINKKQKPHKKYHPINFK